MFAQTFTDTPIGGGERIRGLGHEEELMEEVMGSSKVRPNGLWELALPTLELRGWGGLFAMGEEKLCCGGGEQRMNEAGEGDGD